MQKYQVYFESAGTAEDIEVGFEPTKIIVSNLTQWAVDTKVVESKYWKGQASGYAYNEKCEDTSTNRSLSTSNGFTITAYSTANITGAPTTVSTISAASPAVVTTTAAHGYSTGQKVRIRDIVGNMGTDVLNDNVYVITVLSTTTFSLQAQRGNTNIDTTGKTYTSGGLVYNITESVTNSNSRRVTLGTDVVGANSDMMVAEFEEADYWQNLGDLA